MTDQKRITKPSAEAPDVSGMEQKEAAAAYRSHGWLYLFDAPVAGPMTEAEFAQVPEHERALASE